jgi:2,3-bisphosphoglycerate-dependent phosphoglycerate mutase
MTEPAAPAVTKIIFVRHGQSLANSGGRTTDHDTNPLTELGRAQAKSFAERLPCTPTLIITSPFLRAQQTAEPLRQRFPDVPVEEWPIQEFTFLEPSHHRNTSEADRDPHVSSYWQREDAAYIDGPGAESFSAFLDRAREALRRLVELVDRGLVNRNSAGGCIVLFSHGYFMQALRMVSLFPNATDAELMANFLRFHLVNFIQNTNSLEFEVRDGKIHLIGQPLSASFTFQGETSHA